MGFGALRAVLAVMIGAGACRSTTPRRLSLGGVEVRQVERLAFRTSTVESNVAAAGDWVLEAHTLRVIVAGTDAPRTQTPGSLVDLEERSGERVAVLRSTHPLFMAEGRVLNLVEPRFEPVLLRGRPALRWTARATVGDLDFRVTRDYALDPGRSALLVRTLIRNVGSRRVRDVSTGVELHWGGDAPFAPTLGTQAKDLRASAPWVGRSAHGVAMAWATQNARESLDLHFTEDTHGRERMPSATEATHPGVYLSPGESHEDNDALFLLRGDLAMVTRAVAQLRGEPLGDVRVRVLGDDGEPTTVTVATQSGQAISVGDVSRGLAFFSLPPGQYQAFTNTPGHATGDAERFEVSPHSSGSVPVTLIVPPGGRIRVEAHDADSDRDIPVRIVVRGVHPTRDPSLGPAHSATGAGMIVVAPSGRALFTVAPGTYTVTVSHGPEWSLDTQTVTVSETLRGDVVSRLRREVNTNGWIASDLHVHASPSFDSSVSIEDRVASLVAEGIGFATPTEHNVVGDYGPGVAVLPDTITESLLWVHAVEVTTDQSAQPWGHFNVFPYVPRSDVPHGGPPPYLSVSPHAIFRAARANNPGAFIQVNHPRMQPNIGYFNVTGLDTSTNRAVSPEYDPQYDAIEVFNGFYVGNIPAVESQLQDWYQLLLSGSRYVATGSSDSHNLSMQWAGYPRTYVRLPGREGAVRGNTPTTDEVMQALRAGHAVISSGPMLWLTVQEKGPGDTVSMDGPTEVEAVVRVASASWVPLTQVELWRDGQRVVTLPVTGQREGEPTRLTLRTTLRMQPGSFLTALARGPERALERVMPWSRGTPFAVTNPIWFGRRP